MSGKETFEWKNIIVICIALLMTLLAVTTANAAITLGDHSGNGINTTNGTNIVEHRGLNTFLNFSASDNGDITFLNLTFPAQISLPYNTSANYTLVGLNSTWENITITNNVLTVYNGSSILAFANAEFSINITNITWSPVPNGTYAFLLNTSNTPANSQINLTIGGEPTVTPITFTQSVNAWVTNETVLNFTASISDIGSGVKNATIDITSLNSSAGIINLDFLSGYWMNVSNIVNASQEGRHNITIVSYDNASQVNNTVNFSVWVDNTGPIVVASNYTEVLTWVNNDTLLMLNASINDNSLSGVYNATVNALFINSSLNTVILEHAGTTYWTNYTAAIVNIATQGRVNLTITAYDNVSLYNSSVNFSVWVDNLELIVTPITYGGAQIWVNNGTVLDLNMSIAEQGVVGVNASGVDTSQSYINISAINSTQTAILENLAIGYWRNNTIVVNTSNTGQVNITIWAYDNATNVNSSVNFTMWVDNVKPEMTNLSTTHPNGQTNAKINDTVTLNVTVTDSGGSGLNASSMMVNLSLLNSSLDWVPFDTALGNNNWSLTAFVNNSSTGTINLPVRVSDNATNINDTETISVILDNTPPMFNGTNPIVAMHWDGSATANLTNFYYYYDNTTANPRNFTILVNMTEPGLTVQANFSQVDGNMTLVTASASGNLYTITHPIGNSSNGNTSAGYIRTVMISAMDAASNINMSTSGGAPYYGAAPFIAVVNITPQMFDPTLDGSTTNWTTGIDDFTNVVGLTFDNVSNGKINFTGSVNLCDLTTVTSLQSLSTNMQIASGNMSLNAAANALAAMNVSSNLTMYNLSQFTSAPGIMVDGVPIVDSGQSSGGSVVSNLVWNASGGHNLTFSVTHWTSYQADGGKPFVIPISPLGTTWLKNGSILNLNATVTDAISGVKNATVDVSDVNGTGVAELGLDGSFWINNSLIVATSNEGVFNLTITAYDNVSNMNNSVNLTAKIDVTAPEVTNLSAGYTSSASAVKRGGYVLLNLTAVDPGTLSGLNVSSIQVNLSLVNDTLDWQTFNSASNNNWTYTVLVNNSTSGTINLPVRASDNATNANVSEVISVILDNTPPNASTITYPSDGQVLQSNLTWVNGTTDSDVYSVTIYVNGNVTNSTVLVSNNMYNVSNVPLGGESSATEVNVSSYDALGNVNATNASVTIGVDVANPIIGMVTPNASSVAYKQGGVSLYVNFTYTEGSPKNYTVVISNATATINTSTSASVSVSPVSVGMILNSTAAEGNYSITVTMYDNSSRVGNLTVDNAIVLDDTAPIFTSGLTHIEDAPDGYDNDTSINLTWTAASDTYSPNIIYQVYQDGVLNASTTNTFFNVGGVPDGSHTFNVSATDGAGNVNTTNASILITVDTAAPIAPTIDVPTSMQMYGTSPIWVNGTTTDASNVTIYVNGTATNVSEIVSGNMFNVSNVPLGAGDGTYVINVSAKDAAGNINATNASVTVILDTTDPVITITYPTTVSYNKGGASLYVNFTYTEANAKNYTVMIKNATTTINSTTTDAISSPVSVLFNLNSTAADGMYNVTVTMYDNASLTGNSTVYNMVVMDNTPPTAPSDLTPSSGSYDDDSVSLSWTVASDDLSPTLNYSIYLDDVYNGSTTSTSYTISGVADGIHIFNVSAADAAGNANATNVSTSITVDTVAPTIHNLTLSPNTTSTYNAVITVTVNVSDVGVSGVSAVSAAGKPLEYQSGYMWNGTINAGYGTNIVNVVATDNASNSITNTSLTYTGPTAPSDDGGSSVGSRALLPTPTTEDTEGTVVLSQESKGIALSVPATTIAVDFTKEDIMSIEVEAKEEVSSVYITVQKLDSKPTSIPKSPSGSVHSYLNINVNDIDADNIAGANIAFKVEKKWLSQNNIGKDNVLLVRFSEGVWQQLETNVVNGDDDFVHFSARTPGFSTFAIVAKDVAVTEPVDEIDTSVSVEDPASEVVAEVSAPAEEDGNGLPGFEAIFAVMGLLLVTLLVRKQEKN